MNEKILFEGKFKRSQMEWALWHSFHERTDHPAPAEIPSIFSNRIKRLLDIDGKSTFHANAQVDFAFLTQTPGGNGNDRMFSVFDTFLIGVALDLLDAGLNQGQVVFMLQTTRRKLRGHFSMVIDELDAAVSSGKKYAIPSPNEKTPNNLPAFLLFNRVEMTEIMFPALLAKPVIYDPDAAFGWKALNKFMAKRLPQLTHPTIIEFSKLAFDIQKGLEKAPIVARGRKAKVVVDKVGGKKK